MDGVFGRNNTIDLDDAVKGIQREVEKEGKVFRNLVQSKN